MTWEAWVTVGVVISILVMLTTIPRGNDVIMMGAVTLLMLLGILKPEEALAGLANQGMVTVAAFFVVAASIERTGAMHWVVDRILGRPRSLAVAQLRVMLAPAALSAFMNNTPLVAMMLPVIVDWARKCRMSAAKLLLPMNYAVILGGTCTLVGTSTNLVVNGLLIERRKGMGLPPEQWSMGFFDLAWIGVPALLVGVLYMVAASRWLLPERRPALSETDDPREYTVEMLVEAGSALVGKSIEEAGLRHLPGMYLMEIDRNGHVLTAVAPSTRLQSADRLIFVGVVESVKDLQRIRGLVPATNQVFKLDAPRSQRRLIEAVVSNTCPMIGMTIREGRFRSTYNAAVIAVGRNGQRLRMKIGDIKLQPGDTLLLEADAGFVALQRNSRDFYLVSEVEGSTPLLHEKTWIAAGVLTALVVAVTAEWVSMLQAALAAAILMVLTRCCTSSEARRALDLEVLMMIAASFGVAKALDKTGAAASIANSLIAMASDSPLMALSVVYLVTMTFTELMSNNAAAVLVFPIAWATAANLGVNPMPFVVAVAVAASCGFATPIGYQTNMMVYGPGGYRFSDYLRFGGLLNLIVAAVTITVAPVIWPFR